MLPPDLVQVLAQRNGPTAPVRLLLSRFVEGRANEERLLRELCEHCGGDVYAMASALGVHRTTVIRKLKSYGVSYTRKKSSRFSS